MNSEMKALADRIRFCAERIGGGNSLAQKTAIPRRTLETYLAAQSEPQVSRLVQIAHATGVNVAWLASGEGPRTDDETMKNQIGDRDRLRVALEAVEEGLAAAQRVMSPEKKAELILAAYDLLKDAKEDTKAQIIRFVRAA